MFAQLIGILVLSALFAVYVGANLWARTRGARRKRAWIEDCDLTRESGSGRHATVTRPH